MVLFFSSSMIPQPCPIAGLQRVKKWIQNHQQTILKKHERNEPQTSFERLVAEQKKPPARSKTTRDMATKHDPVIREKRAELYEQLKAKTITQSEMLLALNSTVTDRLQDPQLRAHYSEMARDLNSSSAQSTQTTEFGANSPSKSFQFVQYECVFALLVKSLPLIVSPTMISPVAAAPEQEEDMPPTVVDSLLPHPTSSVDASCHSVSLEVVSSPRMHGSPSVHPVSTTPPSSVINSMLQDQELVPAMDAEASYHYYPLPDNDTHGSYRTTFTPNAGGPLEVPQVQISPPVFTDCMSFRARYMHLLIVLRPWHPHKCRSMSLNMMITRHTRPKVLITITIVPSPCLPAVLPSRLPLRIIYPTLQQMQPMTLSQRTSRLSPRIAL